MICIESGIGVVDEAGSIETGNGRGGIWLWEEVLMLAGLEEQLHELLESKLTDDSEELEELEEPAELDELTQLTEVLDLIGNCIFFSRRQGWQKQTLRCIRRACDCKNFGMRELRIAA